jgi:hypothetical protein
MAISSGINYKIAGRYIHAVQLLIVATLISLAALIFNGYKIDGISTESTEIYSCLNGNCFQKQI